MQAAFAKYLDLDLMENDVFFKSLSLEVRNIDDRRAVDALTNVSCIYCARQVRRRLIGVWCLYRL